MFVRSRKYWAQWLERPAWIFLRAFRLCPRLQTFSGTVSFPALSWTRVEWHIHLIRYDLLLHGECCYRTAGTDVPLILRIPVTARRTGRKEASSPFVSRKSCSPRQPPGEGGVGAQPLSRIAMLLFASGRRVSITGLTPFLETSHLLVIIRAFFCGRSGWAMRSCCQWGF